MKSLRFGIRATVALSCVASLLPVAVPPRAAIAAPTSQMSQGLDLSNIDPTCPACKNFFQYADGEFPAHHPIPADKSDVGSFDILSDHQLDVMHGIMEDVAANDVSAPDTDSGKLGIFYKACVDTAGRNAAGLSPFSTELQKIAAISDTPSLVAEMASLQRIGINAVYSFASEPDPKHSENTIAGLSDGSLGLPEREYYLRKDPKSVKERTDYASFIGKFLELADTTEAAAPAAADAIASAVPSAAASAGATTAVTGSRVVPAPRDVVVSVAQSGPAMDMEASPAQLLAFETALAKLQPTREQRRDPLANYHYVSFTDLQKYATGIDWTQFLSGIGAPPLSHLDVARPDYIINATKLLVSTPLPVVKTYLRYRLLTGYADQLPTAFDDANFAFFGTELNGTPKHRPQWQRCIFQADGSVQDLVSIVFAKKAFTPEAKAQALALITNVHHALHDDLSTLSWMAPHTRLRAEQKLAAMVKKIGYPDHPQDYSALTLTPGPWAQQVIATTAFASAVDMARIGKPTDRTLWGISSDQVNAYYNPSNNEIVFPAGILGLPFFDPTADDAVNYGGIGAVMGHETTHGFDDQGRQYDDVGNLENWWQPSDAASFKTRAQCIVNQFSSYSIAGTHLVGSAVQGEAIADLGGITLAYRAFEKTPEAKAGKKIAGFTPEQRFFLSFAQIWADNQRPASAREQALTDPHPVNMWRVIGTLSNMPEFQKAFHCKAIDAMVRKMRCQIW